MDSSTPPEQGNTPTSETPDDSKRAMELHRRTMGSRYIELFISNKDEHGRALARFGNR